MTRKPTREELEEKLRKLEAEALGHKRTEEDLRQSQQMLQLVMDNIPQAIFWKDKELVYGGCNRKFAEHAGVGSPEEIVGKTDYHLAWKKEEADFFRECDRRVIETGEGVYHIIEPQLQAEGRQAWLDTTKVPLYDDKGNVVGMLGTYEDITERKRAEEKIRESEEKYRSLFDESRDAIYITRKDGKFIDINQSGLDLFGYTREEILGDFNVKQIYVHPDRREKFQHKIEKEGSVRNYPVKFRKKDGTVIDCLLTSTVRRSPDGAVLGYQGLIRDVTEYNRTEKALRESEARYRAIVEAFDGFIYICTQEYRIEFMNGKLIERTGYDATGDFCYRALHGLSSICPWCVNKRVFSGETVRWELQSPKDNRWYYMVNTPIYHSDGTISKQAMILDITKRKMAEEALKQSSEKTKLFAYSVSHDLKSPAVGIYGLAKRLYNRYGNKLDEKGREYCAHILRGSEQIAALVEKINVYISTKELPLALERIKLKEILQIVKDEFSTALNIRRIMWEEPEDLPEITADRLSILRVLRNLVDNALKYGGDRLSRIRIGYDESDLHHILCVTDDGIGIKAIDTEKIFGLFERRDTSKGIEGTGLGLAIVKEIAEQHKGKVWTEPGRDKGTAFYVAISKFL
jgi:PAS domain S-box-containing protein